MADMHVLIIINTMTMCRWDPNIIMRPTQIRIDSQALQHNVQQIRRLAPNKKLLTVLKGNAYGHGLVAVAKALDDVDALGVACLEEAMALREAGIQQRIVLLEGFFSQDELATISQLQLDIVVHHFAQIEMLTKVQLTTPLRVWLKIDTGMHRLGFALNEVVEAWQCLQACSQVQGSPILMTHFSQAEAIDDTKTQQQLAAFNQITQGLQAERSLANSAAILAWPETHADWIRAGLLLYGVSPLSEKTGKDHGLRPVMQFSSQIVAIQHLSAGDAIGYGGHYVCPEAMRVGLVPVGYADGYPYLAPNGTPVMVVDQRTTLVGRVSMDRLAIDLRHLPQAAIGDEVLLWGGKLPVEEIAIHVQTIPYELLCSVQRRAHGVKQ